MISIWEGGEETGQRRNHQWSRARRKKKGGKGEHNLARPEDGAPEHLEVVVCDGTLEGFQDVVVLAHLANDHRDLPALLGDGLHELADLGQVLDVARVDLELVRDLHEAHDRFLRLGTAHLVDQAHD